MARSSKSKLIFIVAAVLTPIVLAVLITPVMVCRDWAFICENTGSRKGYREWVWGSRTKHWYKESPIESFIKEKYPNELQYRWTSYAGTGRNIYGMKVLFGHGRPGAIKYVDAGYLNEYFKPVGDTEKKAFYDLLVSNDQKAINAKVNGIFDELVERRSE